MAEGKIVIVTNPLDPHTDLAITRLRALGHDPIRVHPSTVLSDGELTMELGGTRPRCHLRTQQSQIAVDDIRSIWWRRPQPVELAPGLRQPEAVFASAETRRAVYGFWGAVEAFWMSQPWLIDIASTKPEQLQRASRMGFEIPRTLITTQPDRLDAFFEECSGRIIYKPLTTGALSGFEPNRKVVAGSATPLGEAPKALKTTAMTAELLKQHRRAVSLTPCLFQEYIEKRVELRVTIIGDELFVAEIDSQAQKETEIDWRNYDVPMIMRPGKLPADVAQRCFDFVRSYGLTFSALDIIVTPDGRYVFLENNPNGQWMFVESKIPAFKMTDALLGYLIRGTPRGRLNCQVGNMCEEPPRS